MLWLWVVLGVFAVLYLLPELWARLCLRQPLPHHGQPARPVALTFDDGPDPVTTPRVLALLAEHNVRATFFVLACQAEAHPELVPSLRAQGHDVQSHGTRHVHHWLAPWICPRRDVRHASEVLAAQSGTRPTLYRPPWGMVMAGTLWAARLNGLRLALYDVESGDWLRGGPEAIVQWVLRRVRPGSVVLLHDAARDPEQVTRMVAALGQIIPALRQNGYEFVTMSELLMPPEPRPSLLVRAWTAWEHLFARLCGAMEVTDSIHLVPYVYRGPTIMLDGREMLKRGDRCLDVHFDNQLVRKLPGDATERMSSVSRHSAEDMRRIAIMMRDDPRLADVRGLTAITLFHRQGQRTGFHSSPLEPAWRRRFFTWYMLLIKRIYQGPKTSRGFREVRFIWVTREEFLQHTLPPEA